MAFCTQCGSQIQPGSAFCPACGAPLSSSSGGGRPGKINKPLILGLIGGVVLIGLVLGILALTGVLGGAKGPAGVWQLSAPYNEDGDTYTIVLEKDGTGFLKDTIYWPHSVETDYYPISWNESQIIVNDGGEPSYCYYTWKKELLSFNLDGDYLVFIPSTVPEPYIDNSQPAPGTYQLTGYFEDGEDLSYQIASEFGWVEFTVNANGTATGREAWENDTMYFTWDKHFFYDEDEYAVFYHYENGTITLINGSSQMVLTRVR